MKRDEAREKVEQGIAELHEALGQGRSDQLVRYLEVMARFHNYSFGNVLMIYGQMPQASQVAGFHRWKQLKRKVKKGEKGIAILAPCTYKRKVEEDNGDEKQVARLAGFKVVYVFDVTQTEGAPLAEFAGIDGDPGANLARIEQVIRAARVELVYEDLPMKVKGSSAGGKITVQPGLTPAETFSVLAHELAHERLHHGERRHETTKTIRETEAEAVAFVVCRAFGLDSATRSSDYIQLYRGKPDTLSESLEFIQKTAAWIIEAIDSAAPTWSCEDTRRPVELTDEREAITNASVQAERQVSHG